MTDTDTTPLGTDRVVHAMIGSFALLPECPEFSSEAVVATCAVRSNAATTFSGYLRTRTAFLARMEAELLESQFITESEIPESVRHLYNELALTEDISEAVLQAADEVLDCLQTTAV